MATSSEFSHPFAAARTSDGAPLWARSQGIRRGDRIHSGSFDLHEAGSSRSFSNDQISPSLCPLPGWSIGDHSAHRRTKKGEGGELAARGGARLGTPRVLVLLRVVVTVLPHVERQDGPGHRAVFYLLSQAPTEVNGAQRPQERGGGPPWRPPWVHPGFSGGCRDHFPVLRKEQV